MAQIAESLQSSLDEPVACRVADAGAQESNPKSEKTGLENGILILNSVLRHLSKHLGPELTSGFR
ncbi:hypothetical protein SBDP1_470003 [Syntrophobacter sp. SbD1]|nr:hypothetical protein SBDP1_470003 [Syntrophobacter sp. SbD1]